MKSPFLVPLCEVQGGLLTCPAYQELFSSLLAALGGNLTPGEEQDGDCGGMR